MVPATSRTMLRTSGSRMAERRTRRYLASCPPGPWTIGLLDGAARLPSSVPLLGANSPSQLGLSMAAYNLRGAVVRSGVAGPGGVSSPGISLLVRTNAATLSRQTVPANSRTTSLCAGVEMASANRSK
eukprot:scaffold177_cov334-Pavlova_lutheri.AAC.69